jgi:hypothetical protein
MAIPILPELLSIMICLLMPLDIQWKSVLGLKIRDKIVLNRVKIMLPVV